MIAIALPFAGQILMEEESEDTGWADEQTEEEERTGEDRTSGAATGGPERPRRRTSGAASALQKLIDERAAIIGNSTLSSREQLKLLESNRKTIVMVRGGRIVGTENVVYALIGMSAVVTLVLACLTAFADLSEEVTLTFTGTVVGGLIATVAQKIGRL